MNPYRSGCVQWVAGATHARAALPSNSFTGAPDLRAFGFKVALAAVVRLRAADEIHARKVVRSILGSPGIAEIRAARGRFELELEDLANDSDAVKDMNASVTDVTFSIAGSPALFEIDGKRVKRSAARR